MIMRRLLALALCALMLLSQPPARAEALAPSDSGEAVAALQSRLIELGLLGGKADGIYGKNTAAAVAEARRLLIASGYDIPADGSADERTAELILDESAEDALRTLRSGSKGARVRAIQTLLVDLKMLGGGIDGSYGAATEAAVSRFQSEIRALGVPLEAEDGVANPATVSLLYDDLSKYGFKAPIYFDMSKPLALTADYIYSRAFALIDAPTGELLFAHNEHERMYPASTTKIMTLMLAVERGGLDETVVIPEIAADIPADSSVVPVTPGESMRMIDLLYGLMLNSGNDAANAVAELCAGGIDEFAALMNARAAELGMTGSHFVNPHGYHDDEHYTTAYDMAMLTRQGLTDATFCKIATCTRYVMPATELRGQLELVNDLSIFDPESPDYIEGAAGVKKGYTSAAGSCYVGAAQRNGRTLIAVVLNAPGMRRAFADIKKLFEYGFAR